ncbi:hypothetical protein SODALDRAFT_310623 [Sodiomyces alkalinus F11]|uniref:AMP-dependent synthetase/ligase domain-containing protein n=1 Tax=Sodiomyces alkalinus (strain CBS 110278 / VKM F-3762 / F11) TaxID=1314773 RepID=A0A3N2PXW8_SODAK|nr:hypothetical protein SODALDRAFT_310623 [Sodiomyces alkalinus F11]ROT39256.1 hypothetical protein SODALDRAFT_310623 [Sodiomyces alkalinus F11]
MGVFDNLMLGLDQGLSEFFAQWNAYSTALVTLLVLVISYRLVTHKEPDVHPLLLARQAQSSPVRQEGESPVYRAHGVPHGMALNSGLNIKDTGASKWSWGRDGDLRDIWRRAVAGTPEEAGKPSGTKGRLLTAHGPKIEAHSLDDITRQINLLGRYLHDQGGIRVAIYLPNSIELLATLFACCFYPNLIPILIPFGVKEDELVSMLRRSAADTVVTAPGAFPFNVVVESYPALRQLVWVADEGNRHMDWNEVPQGMGGSVNVATWQDIVQEAPVAAGTELPPAAGQQEAQDIIIFWQGKPGSVDEMVRFSQNNLVSAVAAQLAAVPAAQRLGPSDLFLPADSLTNVYTLALTLTALYSNASLALTSVAGKSADLILATQGVAPTVVVASPETLLNVHQESSRKLSSVPAKLSHWLRTRSLVENGVMPTSSATSGYHPAVGTSPKKLRLVYTAERARAGSPALSSQVLSDLRVCLGARVVYALTAAEVAGAVAQTGYYDYRLQPETGSYSHFGAPVTSTEVILRDTPDLKSTDEQYQGEIVVRGPSVVGNEAALGVNGKILEDNTLAYV